MPLLMIPGPVPVREDVLAALAMPVRSHTSAENATTVRRIQAGVRDCVGSVAARVHVFAGAGTLAMEAAIVNFAKPGDRLVVCSHGYFGDRFVDIAAAFGIDVDVVRSEWGRHVELDAVRRACTTGRAPALVTVTHVDTSSGVLADASALADCCRDSGALLVLDGVCATGGLAEAMDAWGYDVVLTGAQKALGVPPGLAILAVSEAARRRRDELGRIAAYYADLARWDPVVDDPMRYFSTHATSLLRALEVSLDAIAAEGLEARFARHGRVADSLREGMAGLGLLPLTDGDVLAPTLSVLAVPEGVDEARLRLDMAQSGVIVAGCIGAFAGRGIRIGHMGKVDAAEVDATLEAAAAALARQPLS
jgi:alanine-glyoxylate transaminase/serine-glyoxylate transaminase/serine-pyruvate transaminase